MAKKEKEAPAPEGGEGAEGEEGAKKKPDIKKLALFIGAPAILLLGGGGAAAFFLMGGDKGEAHADKDAGKKAEKKDKKKKDDGHGKAKGGEKGGEGEAQAGVVKEGPDGVMFYEVPQVLVNIAAANGRPAFLKLKLTLETKDEAAIEAIEPAMPRVMDQFTGFLREMRMEDLSGAQGAYRLRAELLRRVNLAIAPAKVDAVLIEEMLVQ
jgi:flagellar protein FliL